MSAAAVMPTVAIGLPPKEPICRSAKDATRPCRFSGSCHESRQRIAHYEAIRGRRCWAFQQAAAKLQAHGRHRMGATVCFSCGGDYTGAYQQEMEDATWGKRPDWPDPLVCRACWRPASERRA